MGQHLKPPRELRSLQKLKKRIGTFHHEVAKDTSSRVNINLVLVIFGARGEVRIILVDSLRQKNVVRRRELFVAGERPSRLKRGSLIAEQYHSAAGADPRRCRHWVHVSESPRHLRVMFGGETVRRQQARQARARGGSFAGLLFPRKTCVRIFSRRVNTRRNVRKRAKRLTGRFAAAAICGGRGVELRESIAGSRGDQGSCRLQWPKMDKWMGEDEELFKHARDPFKRVDACRANERARGHRRPYGGGDAPAASCLRNQSSRALLHSRKMCGWILLTASATESRCPYKARILLVG